MSAPLVSLESQIAYAWSLHDRAHEIKGNDSPGKIQLAQQTLSAIARSLQWLSDNKDWIVDAANERRKAAE